MPDNDTKIKRMGWTVLIGYHVWGAGSTMDKAKQAFREADGRLSDGYMILTFDQDTEFVGVSGIDGSTEYIGNPPEKTLVPGRKTKK